MVSDAAKKKAAAKKLKNTAKLQGKDAADKQAAAMSHSAVRNAPLPRQHSLGNHLQVTIAFSTGETGKCACC